MKKLLLLLFFVSSAVFAQSGRPFKVINVDENGTITDSIEVVDLKNLFNSLVHDLVEQLGNQGRFAPGRITNLTADFDKRIARLRTLRDSLNNQDLRDGVQEQIDATIAASDALDNDEEGGRKDKSNKAPAIIAKLNVQLNDVDLALRAAE